MTAFRRRVWLALPAAALIAADAALTLVGQPAAYWVGDRAAAVEANPLVAPVLARGPGAFAAVAVCWLLLVTAVLVWRPAAWLAVGIAAAHAVAGAGWVARGWGLTAGVAYLAAVACAAAWCWRRAAGQLRRAGPAERM